MYTQHLPSEFALELGCGATKLMPVEEAQLGAGHTHDQTITSVGIQREGAVDGDRLNQWLGQLLREQGADIFRMKGILNVHGTDKRVVFQGVHMLFDGREERPWGDATRLNELVFIGRGLNRSALTKGFEQCLV